MAKQTDKRRALPSVDSVIEEIGTIDIPRPMATAIVRDVLTKLRAKGGASSSDAMEECRHAIHELALARLHRVINATGVVLNTNLGRAHVDRQILEGAIDISHDACNLELSLKDRNRGHRNEYLEFGLATLTGAEDALVVNNCAAAVLLACAAAVSRSTSKRLASDRLPNNRLIVSRGELVEIGGEFRVPEIIELSGGSLVEVGTTNKTRLSDYETALKRKSAAVLKVHPSNYRALGFTASVSVKELSVVCKRAKTPLIFDAGSGLIGKQISDEPEITTAIRDGATVVTFSADKLFGGPQAGIIVGQRRFIQQMRKHPLARVTRIGKFTASILQQLVESKLDGSSASSDRIPSETELLARAKRVATKLRRLGFSAEVQSSQATYGGGAAPGHVIPSAGVLVGYKEFSPNALANALARLDVGIICTVKKTGVFCDLISVMNDDELVALLTTHAASAKGAPRPTSKT